MSFKHIVVMPKMSMTMETGELINYHVKPGDHVKAGQMLFEVMTDKIDMEVDSPADGVIDSLIGEVGATIEVGKPVLEMTTETQVMSFDFDTPASEPNDSNQVAEVLSEPNANVNMSEVPPVAAPTVISSVTPTIAAPAPTPVASAPTIPNEKIKAVPKARTLADEKGISLSNIHPTGPDRTVMYSDVANAQADPKILERQAANRDLIARGIEMTRAIPQASFTRAVTASAGSSYEWQAKLLAAWAKTLRSFGYADNGVALIIESKYGSALPVFKNPDQTSDLAKLIETTTDQARNGKVPLAMLSGATTTVFDLTHYKMAANQPLLFPNQATSLTVGIDAQGALSLSLTIDLRALDFYDGANLLDRLTAAL